jgi:hypothetical protein
MRDPTSRVCYSCGEQYSLHMATVCPHCFAWPVSRLRFDGNNCIAILRWTKCQHWDNLELHSTDSPYVYVDGVPVLMEIGDWAVRDSDGKFHVERVQQAMEEED